MFDLTTTDYTDKDFEAVQERLHSTIKTVFPDWLNDDVVAFGNYLLDSFAFVSDIINFYNDTNLREAHVPTAQLLQSMLLFAEGIGTVIPLQSSATADEVFTITASGEDTIIPKYSVVLTKGEDPVYFQTLVDVVISAGDTEATISVENSENITEEFTPSGNTWFAKWLSRSPFLDILSVKDEDGVLWTQVQSLVDSTPSDRHFEVRVNADGLALIRFGDGIIGKTPVEEKDLTVNYKIGGGEAGNVARNTISETDLSLKNSTGQSINVEVNNPDEASGGLNRMSVEAARRFIPAARRNYNSTIANPDFVDNALSVAGVARALMLTSDEEIGIPENMGHLIIIPHGGGLPSTLLKDTVHTMVTITKPCTITFKVDMHDPHYKTIDIIARVYLVSGAKEADAKISITEALEAFFQITKEDGTKNDKVSFGGERKNAEGYVDSTLPFSYVYNEIFDNVYVRKLGDLFLNGIIADVILRTREFPILGTIVLINGDTGGIL